MWNVKCRVTSVECGVWNEKCKVNSDDVPGVQGKLHVVNM